MANYISKIMFGKGLDKNGGRKHTGKQGITLPFFPAKLKTANFSRRIFSVSQRAEYVFFYLRENL